MNHRPRAARRITLQAQTTDSSTIKVVGVGKLGATAIAQLSRHNNPYIECTTFSPDETATAISHGRKILAHETYQRLIQDVDMLFVVAQDGNVEARQLAALARAWGVLTIAVLVQTHEDMTQLSCDADLIIPSSEDNLSDVLQQAVHVLVNSVQQSGLLNLDMEDIQKRMRGGGRAQVGTGRASGASRALQATRQALGCARTKVTNVLITVTSTSALKLDELETVVSTMAQNFPDVSVLVASVFDESMGNTLCVTWISTVEQGCPTRVDV